MEHDEFLIEEYKVLRTEIDEHAKSLRNTEVYTVIAVAALFTWLLNTPNIPAEAFFVPPMLVFIAGFGCMGIALRMWSIGAYIHEIEEHFLPDSPLRHGSPRGWEHYSRGWKRLPDTLGVVLWAAFLVFIIYASIRVAHTR